MRAENVYEYFKEFSPVSLEWVDGNSANVVWALPLSCARALLALSKPLLSKEEEGMEINERVAGEEDDQEEGAAEGQEKGEKEKGKRKLTKDEVLARVSPEKRLSFLLTFLDCHFVPVCPFSVRVRRRHLFGGDPGSAAGREVAHRKALRAGGSRPDANRHHDRRGPGG